MQFQHLKMALLFLGSFRDQMIIDHIILNPFQNFQLPNTPHSWNQNTLQTKRTCIKFATQKNTQNFHKISLWRGTSGQNYPLTRKVVFNRLNMNYLRTSQGAKGNSSSRLGTSFCITIWWGPIKIDNKSLVSAKKISMKFQKEEETLLLVNLIPRKWKVWRPKKKNN